MDLRDRLKTYGYKPTTIKATSAQGSNEVVKSVRKGEFMRIDTQMRPIFAENHRMLYSDHYRGSGTFSEKGDERE